MMSVKGDAPEFLRRKQHIRNGWIIAGLIMLTLPLGGKLALALFYTFVAFAYLDEKPYQQDLKRHQSR